MTPPDLATALAQLERELSELALQEDRRSSVERLEAYHQGKRDGLTRAEGLISQWRRKWCPNG